MPNPTETRTPRKSSRLARKKSLSTDPAPVAPVPRTPKLASLRSARKAKRDALEQEDGAGMAEAGAVDTSMLKKQTPKSSRKAKKSVIKAPDVKTPVAEQINPKPATPASEKKAKRNSLGQADNVSMADAGEVDTGMVKKRTPKSGKKVKRDSLGHADNVNMADVDEVDAGMLKKLTPKSGKKAKRDSLGHADNVNMSDVDEVDAGMLKKLTPKSGKKAKNAGLKGADVDTVLREQVTPKSAKKAKRASLGSVASEGGTEGAAFTNADAVKKTTPKSVKKSKRASLEGADAHRLSGKKERTPKLTKSVKKSGAVASEDVDMPEVAPGDAKVAKPATPKSLTKMRKAAVTSAEEPEVANSDQVDIITPQKRTPGSGKKLLGSKEEKAENSGSGKKVRKSTKRRAEGEVDSGESPDTPSPKAESGRKPSAKKLKKSVDTASRKPGRFDLKRSEQTETPKAKSAEKKTKTKKGSNGTRREDSGTSAVDDVEDSCDGGTPDVTFHKQMTKAKAGLLKKPPIADLVPKEAKDAAAKEVLERRLKGSGKRKLTSEGSDILMLDVNAAPPAKKPRENKDSDAEPLDANALKARRKEARILKRKVRQMRSRGELPDGKEENAEPGVLYLGHVPHGFFEKEIRGYFSQFGEVLRVHLSRSKKTARSRGFAFIEFADKDVAAVAAKAMDGYLMHGRSLVAKYVPPEKLHEDTFKGATRTFKKVPWSALERRGMIQRAGNPKKLAERSRLIQKRAKAKKAQLSKMGIEYEFPDIVTGAEEP